MKRIICLVGATATGKTGVGIELAKLINAEVVSADSIQVYKGLDIGSAKPTPDEMQSIPHYLLDVTEIDNADFSVSEYRRLAKQAIDYILVRGKVPLVVGGTGLYINALTYPLSFAHVKADNELRTELLEKEKAEPYILHRILEEVDPVSAQRLHKNDTKRIIRALEVYYLTGKPLSEHGNSFQNPDGELEYSPILFGLTMPRELLYERINIRVDKMIESGLIEEVNGIMRRGYDPSLPALQGIGYKQLIAYLSGNSTETLEETIELIKRETRRFAKRQITWFKRDKRIHWIDITQFATQKDIAEHIAQSIYKEEA